MFNIVLLEPEIPANTGNIGRTCLVTGSRLHIIEPCGFILNDKNLKRAGMDYWKDLDVTVYDCLKDFLKAVAEDVDLPDGFFEAAGMERPKREASSRPAHRLWLATTKARKTYSDAGFADGDYIMFGKESAGIPEEMLMAHKEGCIRIPMAQEQRSLNLSNSVAIVLYEALRQNSFKGLELQGQLQDHVW